MGRYRALHVAALVALALAVVAPHTPLGAWIQAVSDPSVRRTWMSFEKGPACVASEAAEMIAAPPDPAAGPLDLSGVRGLYCFAARTLPAVVIEGVAGVPIFRSGPHKNGKLDLRSVDFGQYNPAFVRWAAVNLVPGARDTTFRQNTQALYDRHLRNLVRAYAASNHYFETHSSELTRIARDYKAAIDAAKAAPQPGASAIAADAPVKRLSDALIPVADCITTPKAGAETAADGITYEDAAAAAAFWVRRAMDGTRGQFTEALAGLRKAYDPSYTPAVCAGTQAESMRAPTSSAR